LEVLVGGALPGQREDLLRGVRNEVIAAEEGVAVGETQVAGRAAQPPLGRAVGGTGVETDWLMERGAGGRGMGGGQ